MTMSIQQAKAWREFIEVSISLQICATDPHCGIVQFKNYEKQVKEAWDKINEYL